MGPNDEVDAQCWIWTFYETIKIDRPVTETEGTKNFLAFFAIMNKKKFFIRLSAVK